MGISYKIFIFSDDGKMQHISNKLYNDLHEGNKSLPQYAKQTVRLAFAFIEFEERKPVRLQGVGGYLYRFDKSGLIDRGWEMEQAAALLDAADTGFMKDVKIQNNVRDISKELSKRKAKEYRWQPTPKEVDKIVNAIWPKKNVARRKRNKLVRIPISQKNQPQKNEEG